MYAVNKISAAGIVKDTLVKMMGSCKWEGGIYNRPYSVYLNLMELTHYYAELPT